MDTTTGIQERPLAVEMPERGDGLGVTVRPAWERGCPELSARAAALLHAEWQALGLLDEDPDEKPTPRTMWRDLNIMQTRGTVTPLAPRRTDEPRMVVAADTGRPAPEARSAEFTGVLLSYAETALIGRDSAGRSIRERFKHGSVRMPPGAAPLVNVAHDRRRLIGHLTAVWDERDAVMCRGVVADRTRDGHDAVELAQLGSLGRLSVEFLPMSPKITASPEGGRMVEHSSCLLLGVGWVPAGAYDSARITRLLDRAEAGKQREGERQRAVAELQEQQRRAHAADVRADAMRVLDRTRRKSA